MMTTSEIVQRFLPDPNRDQLAFLAGAVTSALVHIGDPDRKARLTHRRNALVEMASCARFRLMGEPDVARQISAELSTVDSARSIRKAIAFKGLEVSEDRVLDALEAMRDQLEAQQIVASAQANYTPVYKINQQPSNGDLRPKVWRLDEKFAAERELDAAGREIRDYETAQHRKKMGLPDYR